MDMFFITTNPSDLEELNQITKEWTYEAARGECAWICADCSCSFSNGMPDDCIHGDQRCTKIIQRDKERAKKVLQ